MSLRALPFDQLPALRGSSLRREGVADTLLNVLSNLTQMKSPGSGRGFRAIRGLGPRLDLLQRIGMDRLPTTISPIRWAGTRISLARR